MSYCAPSISIKNHYTCFEHLELIEIAKAFNKWIETEKICKGKQCVIQRNIYIKNKTKKELWKSIYSRMNRICKYEYCWVNMAFINIIKDENLKDKLKYFTFKPRMTKTRWTWLTTSDINQIMQQYQEFDSSFKFLGALPSDILPLAYTDILKWKRIGAVFNLDTHEQIGSHWVAFLIDNEHKTIEYFDSIGNKPNKWTSHFIQSIMDYFKSINLSYLLKINKQIHQMGDSECGIYSIYYLVQRLLGYTFEQITTTIIRDSKMNHFRNVIFRPRN